MAICPNCGTNNLEGSRFCNQCGSKMPASTASRFHTDQTLYTPPVKSADSSQYHAPPPMETGGLIAWSIISILLCFIPGVVALVYAVSINSSPTAEIQLNKRFNAELWCTVATGLGVIAILLSLVLYRW